ncbi:MAG TPA: hypothetical protein VNT99_02430 [Methylomirabilota bacterium]|nr:hypothetical protein [Methylomirabilota bacterium]
MKRNTSSLAILAISLVTVTRLAFAEDLSVARMVFFNAKPGSKASLEEAIKKQIASSGEQTNQWRWLTWEYASGEIPRYCVATFGHVWAEFDHPPAGSQAELEVDAASMLSPTPPVVQYFEHLDEVSDFGMQTNTPTLAEISTFQLHYGKTSQFYAALREFHDALQRIGGPNRYEWFELRSGGETPQFMLMLPRANWAAVDTSADPFLNRLEETLGKKKAAKLFEQFTSAVKSHQRSVVRLRPDLSLLPKTN